VNRCRELKLICAGLSACFATAAFAKDDPPSLSIDQFTARGLLAPIDEAATLSSYRVDPGPDPSGGQRAKLTFDLGEASLFAITGRIKREAAPTGPLDPNHARLLGQKRESGKVYGAGVSGTLHGIDLSATYQYSKISAEQGDTDTVADGPGRSHSLRATARLRFRR